MDKKNQNNKKTQSEDRFWYKILILFSLFLFGLIIPPFLKNGIIQGHDSQIHMVYLRSFTDALSQGQFPVRWIEWYAPGLNQPLFNFYQPMFYYLFQFPKILGFSYSVSFNLTILSLWLLSGVFMYLFVKRHFGVLGGIIASAFYVFAPYHILDIFVRVALPEFTALAFVPALFWTIKAFKDTGKGLYLFLGSVFTAFIILAHPPTMLMFFPLVLGYTLYLYILNPNTKIRNPKQYQNSNNQNPKKIELLNFENSNLLRYSIFDIRIFCQVLGLVFGFGIALFFILPAFLEQEFIQNTFLKAGYYSYETHFVCIPQLFIPSWGYGMSLKGCTDGMSFQLGIAHWIIVIVTILILARRIFWFSVFGSRFSDPSLPVFSQSVKTDKQITDRLVADNRQQRTDNRVIILFLGFVFLSLFMTLSVSKFIWDSFYYLSFVQYPWRFLAVAVFASSFLSGSLVLYVKKEAFKYALYAGLLLLVLISYIWYLKPQYGKGINEVFNASDFSKGKNIFQDGIPEIGYMPKWAYVNPGITDFKEGKGARVKGTAEIKRTKNTPTNKEYRVLAKTKARILFDTHYFPGWKIVMDGKSIEPLYENMFGLIEVKIEPGEHNILLSFSNTPVRSLGNKLSIFFLFASLMLIFAGKFKFRVTNPVRY